MTLFFDCPNEDSDSGNELKYFLVIGIQFNRVPTESANVWEKVWSFSSLEKNFLVC